MTFCSESGGNGGTGLENTGALGFLTFGGTVVNYTDSVTSQSNSSLYTGEDYYVGLPAIGINIIFPTADGFIGFFDATPPPPAFAFDWFLCNDDPSCGTVGIVCHQIMLEVSSVPDLIRLVGVEGAFETVTDLIDAFGGNTGCPNLTVYPLPCGTISLPVTLVGFDVEYSSNGALLTWQTASETNSNYFLIEQSNDGENFTTIGQEEALGNSNEMMHYEFTDLYGRNKSMYYRLSQIDFDGVMEVYSPIYYNGSGLTTVSFSVYPNPAAGTLAIESDEMIEKMVILDLTGKTVKEIYSGHNKIDVSSLIPGLYFIQASTRNGVVSRNFIKE
jgi:hypothetical protein